MSNYLRKFRRLDRTRFIGLQLILYAMLVLAMRAAELLDPDSMKNPLWFVMLFIVFGISLLLSYLRLLDMAINPLWALSWCVPLTWVLWLPILMTAPSCPYEAKVGAPQPPNSKFLWAAAIVFIVVLVMCL